MVKNGGILMPTGKKPQNKKKFPIIPVLIIGCVGFILVVAGGFAFGASQESHDPFCASCHTMPETTFVQNSTAGQPVDLASYHTPQNTLCIDCHSGEGIQGRVQAELMGAVNAAKWFTGTAVQPAVLAYPIGDQNCLKCHQDVAQRGFSPKESITVPTGVNGGRGDRTGRQNHFHEFLARWQAASPQSETCTSCHSGHAADVAPQNGFMVAQNVQSTCNACHNVLRKGEGD